MRYTPLALCLAVLASPGVCHAQTVEVLIVAKGLNYKQVAPADVQLFAALDGPYEFDVTIGGEDLGGIAAPSVTGPITNPEPGHNGGVLGYIAEDDEWRYGSPFFEGWTGDTKATLDSLFANGTYTIHALGQSVPLDLTGDAYPSAAPVLTITGGVWSYGTHIIASDQELAITTSPFAEFGDHVEDVTVLEIFGPGYSDQTVEFAGDGGSASASLVVPASTLPPGNSYRVDAIFSAVVDFNDSVPGMPDALAAALYEKDTQARVYVRAPGCRSDVTTTNTNPGDDAFGLPDETVNGADLSFFVEQWFNAFSGACAPCVPLADMTTTDTNPGDPGYGVPDGTVNGTDLSFYVESWLAGCR